MNAIVGFFLLGLSVSWIRPGLVLPQKIHKVLTFLILLLIGLKGGGPLVDHFTDEAPALLGALIGWGLVQPFIAYFLLKLTTKIDRATAAAIAASFGSISVMTFASGAAFLESQQISFQKLIIGALAILEVPAIISGLVIAKKSGDWKKMIFEAFFNKTVLTLVAGLILGAFFFKDTNWTCYKPLLCLFLFDMGLHVGLHRQQLRSFSWTLTFFGFYMPLLGAFVGLLISYLLHLDVGTGTLIAVLLASASYIAVPAAMRIALPQAKESVYLPLALGVTFPFNIFVGIPIYFNLAQGILK
jgi:hypothetical protein